MIPVICNTNFIELFKIQTHLAEPNISKYAQISNLGNFRL